MRRRKSLIVLLAAFAMVTAACGDEGPEDEGTGTPTEETTAPEETESQASELVRVALILPCATNDLTWCQQAYDGARALEAEGLIELAYIDNAQQDAATMEQHITGYAEQGYDLVIGHSFNYGDPMLQIAGNYPEVDFAWQGGINGLAENVADYDMPLYQASYLAGILAGGLSETGVLGGTGGFDIPTCHAIISAFEAGAMTVNPDVRQLATYIGDWQDVAKAKEAALAQADQGADVFVACGDGPSQGMIEAIKDRGLSGFGYVGDSSPLAPENLIGSQIFNLEAVFRQMVADVAAGTFEPGKFYQIGLQDDGVFLHLNPGYSVKEIPDDVMAAMEEAQQQIIDGTFEVPYIPE